MLPLPHRQNILILFLILTMSVSHLSARELTHGMVAGESFEMDWISSLEIGQIPASLKSNIHTANVNNQQLFVATDQKAGCELVATWLIRLIVERNSQKQWTTLGLATGRTPIDVYHNLVAAFQQGQFSANRIKTFNLDEYLGLSPDHPASYAHFMTEHLFSQLGIMTGQTNIPYGLAHDSGEEVQRYQQLLNNNPRDIQLLGIGRNGHIGFNEPGSDQYTRTRLVNLSESTRQANSMHFILKDGDYKGCDQEDCVPKQAITMGTADILESRVNILMAWGEQKSEAVYKSVMGEISPDVPASFLQNHPHTLWILDKDAASKLSLDLNSL